MENLLKDDERLDYLLAENLRIIQSPPSSRFHLMPSCLQNLHMSRSVRGKLSIYVQGTGQFRFF